MWGKYDLIKHSDITGNVQTGKLTIDLPKNLFWGYAPLMATVTDEYMTDFGLFPVGDLEDLQQPSGDEMIMVKWDISTMVDSFINGYKFAFYNRNDINVINDLIDEYFTKVNDALNSGNMDAYEFDSRLEDIDAFNRALFEQNKGKIISSRKEIIEKAKLSSLFPELVMQENIYRDMAKVTDYNKNQVVYDPFDIRPTKQRLEVDKNDNPLAPVFSQEPIINTNPKYVSKYISPEERRLTEEYERAKLKLKNKERNE